MPDLLFVERADGAALYREPGGFSQKGRFCMSASMNFDAKKLRGLLAEQQVTHAEFARRCGLSRAYTSLILNERYQPGELAQIKVARGLVALGLDRQVADA